VGFVGMMLFNSLDLIPQIDKAYLVQTTTFLLTVALAAMKAHPAVPGRSICSMRVPCAPAISVGREGTLGG
jgi:hypothetical protein